MTKSEEQARSDVYALLPHPQANAVCMLRTDQGWTLPHVTIGESLWIRAGARLNHALQDLLKLPVISLLCLHYQNDSDAHLEEQIYVVEDQNASTSLPPGASWLTAAQLSDCELAIPHHGPIIEGYLQEMHDKVVPQRRPPWSRTGWFDEASAWIQAELTASGYDLLGPVEQTNTWCLSCVLSVPTSRGTVYFKASPDFPLFVNEPSVVAGLCTLFPENIPTPLSVDRPRRWMLLEDFGSALDENRSVEHRSIMLSQFARLQQEAAAHIPYLLNIGCIDRRLHRLHDQIDDLVKQVERDDSLHRADLAQLREAVPELKALCHTLVEFGIPETLNHGDLHLGNVAYRDGHLLFFDWTDACIGHPFLDMISIFNEREEALQAQLRDHYLSMWRDYASLEQLREAWEVAKRLSALHQAITYQSLLLQLEETPRKAFGNVFPHFIGRALAIQLPA